MIAIFVFLGIIGFLILLAIGIYNNLVALKIRTDNAWSQIDVQLKRRNDLIPNLVETVKGYAAHEKEVFTRVTEARAAVMKGGSVADQAQAENMLSGALKSLFAVAEAYPELKANENFLMLQGQLATTEDQISSFRQLYNDAVMQYNTAIQQFPGNIFAGIFGFASKQFFDIPEGEKAVPQVKF
jgi:LemA protein